MTQLLLRIRGAIVFVDIGGEIEGVAPLLRCRRKMIDENDSTWMSSLEKTTIGEGLFNQYNLSDRTPRLGRAERLSPEWVKFPRVRFLLVHQVKIIHLALYELILLFPCLRIKELGAQEKDHSN